MPQPDRPLPECLTRLLDARAAEPTPGDPRPSGGGRGPRARTLDGVVLRVFVYNVAGAVWLGILWQALRRLAR